MKLKWLRPLCKWFVIIVCVLGIERFCHKQTRGFSLPNIYSSTSCTEAASAPLNKELLPSFSEPFTFLDSGLESYAFISQDGKIVLKLFKHHHIRQAKLLAKLLPLPYFIKLAKMKEMRLLNSFASCKIAYEELKEETGLLFMHLGKTMNSLPRVTLIDKLGIEHKVALDEVHFFVQKKADLLLPALEKDMAAAGVAKAKKRIYDLLALIVERCKKGIADRDPTLCKNYGFLDERAIVIDVGSFSKNPHLMHPQLYKRELFYETLPLRCLLTRHFPELVVHFDEEFERIIGSNNS